MSVTKRGRHGVSVRPCHDGVVCRVVRKGATINLQCAPIASHTLMLDDGTLLACILHTIRWRSSCHTLPEFPTGCPERVFQIKPLPIGALYLAGTGAVPGQCGTSRLGGWTLESEDLPTQDPMLTTFLTPKKIDLVVSPDAAYAVSHRVKRQFYCPLPNFHPCQGVSHGSRLPN